MNDRRSFLKALGVIVGAVIVRPILKGIPIESPWDYGLTTLPDPEGECTVSYWADANDCEGMGKKGWRHYCVVFTAGRVEPTHIYRNDEGRLFEPRDGMDQMAFDVRKTYEDGELVGVEIPFPTRLSQPGETFYMDNIAVS